MSDSDAEPTAELTLDPSSVLVVDDDPVGIMILTRLLKEMGCRVVVTERGEESLEIALETPPDLVLLDVSLPGIDGYEVARALRAAEATSIVPIIFISGHKTTLDKVRAFEAGANDYMTKPFDPEEVRIRIDNQLRIARLQKTISEQNRELRRANDELKRRQEAIEGSRRSMDRIFTALSEVLPGTILDDRYQLDKVIGSGGFGTVYRGTHLVMDRPIAVKVLQPPHGPDAEAQLKRFRSEAMSAYRFQHANAVIVLDAAVSASGLPYIVMELLNGWSLRHEIRLGRLDLGRCAEIMVPVCDVINHAHRAGLTHRDIKPDNIFIHDESGRETVKVLDFGLARLHDLTQSEREIERQAGLVFGTPTYMAPEIFTREATDPQKIDVYAIAMVAFEALTGKAPFPLSLGSAKEIVARHLAAERPRVSQYIATIPQPIDDLILAAMDRDPEKRPTVRAFGEQFVLALFADSSEPLTPEDQKTMRLFATDEIDRED